MGIETGAAILVSSLVSAGAQVYAAKDAGDRQEEARKNAESKNAALQAQITDEENKAKTAAANKAEGENMKAMSIARQRSLANAAQGRASTFKSNPLGAYDQENQDPNGLKTLLGA